MRAATLLALAALAAVALADCENSCSGHGTCGSNSDYCTCFLGWRGNDCSDRTCPLGTSFIDTPIGDLTYDNTQTDVAYATPANPSYRASGEWETHPAQQYGLPGASSTQYAGRVKADEGHFYYECSNRGLCDRGTGLCNCFTGYEGAACNRTVCPNSCSGHGTCQVLNELTPKNLHYRLWDTDKTQACVCDGGYFGLDCSQRKCQKNDDPLTTKSSRVLYSYGLDETAETQFVDVRCPYGGTVVNKPKVSLWYTDVQFGDRYETSVIDLSSATASADVLAALKALPNQVLADFVDPVRGNMVKIDSVLVSPLDGPINSGGTGTSSISHYRIQVVFNELLGDVPSLGATPYFKCIGGAEVNSLEENILVSYSANSEGPATFLEIDMYPVETALTTFRATFYDSQSPSRTALATDIILTPAITTGLVTLSAVAGVPYEATKVILNFGLADGVRRSSRFNTNIKIWVAPTVKTTNKMSIFRPYAADVTATANRRVVVSSVTALNSLSATMALAAATVDDGTQTYDVTARLVLHVIEGTGSVYSASSTPSPANSPAVSPTPSASQTYATASGSSTSYPTPTNTASGTPIPTASPFVPATNLARLYVNDELIGLVDLTGAATANVESLYIAAVGPFGAAGSNYHTRAPGFLYNARRFLPTITLPSATTDGLQFVWSVPKVPVQLRSTAAAASSGLGLPDLLLAYRDDVAPTVPISLVLKVTSVSGTTDRFAWRVAGDTTWQTERNFQATANSLATYVSAFVPGDCTALDNRCRPALVDYLAATDIDDPARQQVNRVLLTWDNVDSDYRIVCTTETTYWYIQLGSQGVNDSPECSDRGLCDYSSGLCKCFKGYAGIDCSMQNALSTGGAGGGAGGA